jgi:integrase
MFRRYVKIPWPQLLELPANRIAPEMIRDVLARMLTHNIGCQTNHVRAYLHAAFMHGAHSDLDPRRAATDAEVFKLSSNPVALIPRLQEFETARERILSDEEFAHLWAQLDLVRPEIALTLRCLILLGGQRFLQLLRATWIDYDTKQQVVMLADPKGKRIKPVPHLLPISPRVAQLLAQLRGFNGDGEFIFSTTAGEKPIHSATFSGIFRTIAQSVPIQQRASAAPFQGRDIRRSIETRLQALGVSREIRAQLLSHGRSGGVQQKHYERYEYIAEKADALAKLENHLFTIFESHHLHRNLARPFNVG